MKKNISLLCSLLHADRTVIFIILARIWSTCSALITALLIAKKFSPIIQGYYYTFSSLLAFQIFIELGLSTVITQFASHEWAGLSLDSNGVPSGDKDRLSRLQSLARFSTRWYFFSSILLTMALGAGGSILFARGGKEAVVWAAPWISLCLLNGLLFFLLPLWSLLEGCNQVLRLYTFRFYQAIIISIAMWAAIYLGAELWTASVSIVLNLVCSFLFLVYGYRRFFTMLIHQEPAGARIDWIREIWPLQWRITISSFIGSLGFFLFTPALFCYHGALVAGQFGMTWSFVFFAGTIANSWMTPKIPHFGILIAKGAYRELDILFFNITRITIIVIVLLSLCFWMIVYGLNVFHVPLAHRLLSPLETGLLLIAQFFYTLSLPFAYYLRAHKKEPLLLLSVLHGALSLLSTLFLGRYYSALGLAAGYLAVNMAIFPCALWVWFQCRKKWHSNEESGNPEEEKGI